MSIVPRMRWPDSSIPSNRRNSFTSKFLQLRSHVSTVHSEELSVEDIIVAVMGPTGSGKSSFIELATGMAGIAGHSLQSFTSDISVIRVAYPGGVNLCFVDTPGFDDTTKSDLDIFKLISHWLNKTYGKQILLTGLLYFHRISDVRIAGTSLKNLRLFERLCGENFSNIVFTTTMWDEVDEPVGARREQELEEHFWGPMLKRGASIKRFLYTRESAFEILLPIFYQVNEKTSRALLLQNEMNDRGLLLKETSAGRTLFMELGELVTRHQEALRRIRRELKDPTGGGPEQLQFLMEDYQRVSLQLQRAGDDMRRMKLSTRWRPQITWKTLTRLVIRQRPRKKKTDSEQLLSRPNRKPSENVE